MASDKKAMQIGGAVMLVQVWVYLRFPLICPITRPPQQPMQAGSLANRYVLFFFFFPIIQFKYLLVNMHTVMFPSYYKYVLQNFVSHKLKIEK